jgi:MATE family multidrug resistance protein
VVKCGQVVAKLWPKVSEPGTLFNVYSYSITSFGPALEVQAFAASALAIELTNMESDECHIERGWWRRPCGGRAVVRLALPLVISTASWTIMHVVDRIFLARYSTAAVAGAMPAGVLHFAVICLPLGIASYVTTFVAQYFGANRKPRIGRVLWQGVFLGIATIPLFLLLIPLAPVLFAHTGHPAGVAAQEVFYFQALAYGGGATVISAALAGFFTGLGASRVVMIVDVSASVLNIVLDYVMIFGLGGIPEMGIRGAGWATSLAQWSKVAGYTAIILLPEFRRSYRLAAGCRWDSPLMLRLLRFGGPSGLQLFFEVAAFTLLTFLMGRLGEVTLAATTVAFSVNAIAFVPMIGLGIAVSAMVGQQLGASRPELAERATWTALWLGVVYTAGMAILYLSVPGWFLWAHSAGRSDEFAEVAAMCRVLLRFVAAYCVLDMGQIIFSSAIKGAGDTRFVLATAAVIAPFPALLGWLGLEYWGWGLYALWYVITGWICLLCLIFYLRFQRGPWRSMRVIETVPVDPAGPVNLIDSDLARPVLVGEEAERT